MVPKDNMPYETKLFLLIYIVCSIEYGVQTERMCLKRVAERQDRFNGVLYINLLSNPNFYKPIFFAMMTFMISFVPA